jgi:hypothetical protein
MGVCHHDQIGGLVTAEISLGERRMLSNGSRNIAYETDLSAALPATRRIANDDQNQGRSSLT